MKSSSKARALIQSVDDDSMATVLFPFFFFFNSEISIIFLSLAVILSGVSRAPASTEGKTPEC